MANIAVSADVEGGAVAGVVLRQRGVLGEGGAAVGGALRPQLHLRADPGVSGLVPLVGAIADVEGGLRACRPVVDLAVRACRWFVDLSGRGGFGWRRGPDALPGQPLRGRQRPLHRPRWFPPRNGFRELLREQQASRRLPAVDVRRRLQQQQHRHHQPMCLTLGQLLAFYFFSKVSLLKLILLSS